MEMQAFLEAMQTADEVIDLDRAEKLIIASVENYDPHADLQTYYLMTIAMEELSELQKEISKFLRTGANKAQLTREVAHCYRSLEYVKRDTSLDIDEIHKAINVKLDQLATIVRYFFYAQKNTHKVSVPTCGYVWNCRV